MSKAQYLAGEFASRATVRGGIHLFTAGDAIELIREAERRGVRVLGIDTFLVDGQSIVPQHDHILDLTVGGHVSEEDWNEASHFVAARRQDGFHFEVVLGDAIEVEQDASPVDERVIAGGVWSQQQATASPALSAPHVHPHPRSCYRGWPVVAESETDGWYYGEITELDDGPDGCASGDGFVVAPDGSTAGIVWEVGEFAVREVLPPSEDRWGVYGVAFPRPIRDVADLIAHFRAVLPELQIIHRRVRSDRGAGGP